MLFMNIIRKIALSLAGLLLLIALPLHTFIWTSRQTILNRPTVLSWLKDGKVYDNAADVAAVIARDNIKDKDSQTGEENKESAPDTETLVKAAKVALPPNTLQQNSEIFINSMYDWVEGKTSAVVMNIDLSREKVAFIEALGDEAVNRAASLQTCTTPLDGDFDPLASSCIPAGVNVAAQIENFKNELKNNKDFFPDTTFTGEDLKVGVDGGEKKVIWEAYGNIPNDYKQFRVSAFEMSGVLVILALAVYFLGKTRRTGLKVNAWIFGLVGTLTLLIGLALRFGSSSILENVLSRRDDIDAASMAILTLSTQIAKSFYTWYFILGAAYLAVVIICVFSLVSSKRSKPKDSNEAGKAPEPKATQAQANQISTPVEKYKSKTATLRPKAPAPTPKKTNLIQ